MFQFIAIFLALLVGTFYIIRGISKLPSRYERKPRELNAWNALDQGIDPSIKEEQ